MMAFKSEFAFAELHMPAVRRAIGGLPMRLFMDIETAPAKIDMEQATDLIITLGSGDIAVRVRRRAVWDKQNKLGWGHDWSVRAICRGYKTEIHKLQEGFGRWYFMAYSFDDAGALAEWWLIDLDEVRKNDILTNERYPVYPNGDGTSGKYIKISDLKSKGCILAEDVVPHG